MKNVLLPEIAQKVVERPAFLDFIGKTGTGSPSNLKYAQLSEALALIDGTTKCLMYDKSEFERIYGTPKGLGKNNVRNNLFQKGFKIRVVEVDSSVYIWSNGKFVPKARKVKAIKGSLL